MIMTYHLNDKQRMIRAIEELSMNVWPSRETVLYDGWVLRFNDGYTRRANSINPLYPSTLEISAKVSYCERLYLLKNLRPVYKITHHVCPPDLDVFLDDHEYRREAETSVQIMALAPDSAGGEQRVTVSADVDDHWVRRFMSMNRVDDDYSRIITSMLERIAIPRCFASIVRGKEIVACGIGAVENQRIGLFDIVVDSRCRQKGLGTQLVCGILEWARCLKVRSAYLQVMRDNAPALAMYKKIGFKELYRYWYRVR